MHPPFDTSNYIEIGLMELFGICRRLWWSVGCHGSRGCQLTGIVQLLITLENTYSAGNYT